MALLERRIGLLFAAFLTLLLLAAGRALFLGTIKGSSLANAAASQQVSSLELPARARHDRRSPRLQSSRSQSPPTTSPPPRT